MTGQRTLAGRGVRYAVLALAQVLLLLLVAQGRCSSTPAPAASARPVASSVFGGPPRPPRRARLSFGAQSVGSSALEGLEPTPRDERPAARRLTGAAAEIGVDLAPDSAGMTLSLLARTDAGPVPLRLLVNGVAIGVIELGPELTLHGIAVPGEHLFAQHNRLNLVKLGPASAGVTLVAAWLEPTSAALLVPVGAPPPGARAEGFGPPAPVDGRVASRLARAAHVTGAIDPVPRDYTALVVGRSVGEHPVSLGLSLDRAYLGELTLTPTWGTRLVDAPGARLARGTVTLDLLLTQGQDGEVAIEWVGLAPLRPSALLDIGDASSHPFVSRGLSFDERAGGRTAAWSESATTELSVPLAPTSDDYVLSLSLEAFAPLAPLAVAVSVNGQKLGSVTATGRFSVCELGIPHDALLRGANELELSYARSLRPADTGTHSTDQRELAVMLDWLELRPASAGASLAEAPP